MTAETAWQNLPNAPHIDRILADLQRNPKAWAEAARDRAGEAAGVAVRDAAWKAARDRAGVWARVAVRDAAWDAVSALVAWDAVSALIAWDYSARFLDMTPDQLQVWIGISDDPAAMLLLPAVVALSTELEMA